MTVWSLAGLMYLQLAKDGFNPLTSAFLPHSALKKHLKGPQSEVYRIKPFRLK